MIVFILGLSKENPRIRVFAVPSVSMNTKEAVNKFWVRWRRRLRHMAKVYVKSGSLSAVIVRPHYPTTDVELVSVIKEAIDKHPNDELELGTLIAISRKRYKHSKDDYWISAKSALKKAGFKVEEV